jgi:hypothetical protein
VLYLGPQLFEKRKFLMVMQSGSSPLKQGNIHCLCAECFTGSPLEAFEDETPAAVAITVLPSSIGSASSPLPFNFISPDRCGEVFSSPYFERHMSHPEGRAYLDSSNGIGPKERVRI